MKPLRDAFDRVHPYFAKGGILEKAYPVYEALDTFLFTPGETTRGRTHVRDAIDLKRMMITVVMSLIPVTLFGMWNVGYQANSAIVMMTEADLPIEYDWHNTVHTALGLGHDPSSFIDNFVYGAIFFIPIYVVTMFVGGHIEMVFSVLRGHEINEGFLVTGLLYPLTLPPSIPLWQVALGIAFGVIVAKEVFGGTGRNFLNIALTSRAFLYFSYAASISGDKVWTAVDGFSGATALGQMAIAEGNAVESLGYVEYVWGDTGSITWMDSFLGTIQGCIGETSALLCIVGAVILIASGIGSWRIMLSVVLGVIGTSLLLNAVGSETNAMFGVPFYWHLVIGGLAFGLVFMATDPVSASMTNTGKWFYGILIGFMTVLIRVINPAFPEGIMLAILFGNVFAPLIDYFVVQANVRRRIRPMLAKDSTSGTLLIATVLCVVCSLAVSAAAVALKPYQTENAKLDQKKNILDAAGIPNDEFGKSAANLSASEIDDLYKWVEEKMVDLDTGDYNAEFDKSTFNLEEQATDVSMSEPIVGEPYDNGEDRRPKTMKVFLVRQGGEGPLQQVVLPIYGKGLWGTMWGYLALQNDLKTVQGITFYQHKETPGLGGEVDNPGWKIQWDGLQLYDDQGEPAAYVAKGPAPAGDPSAVDGLSGATITSRGVTDLVQYWASDQGYGPFLKKLKAQMEEGSSANAEASPSAGNTTTKAGA